MIDDPIVKLFNDETFRLGWYEFVLSKPWDEQRNNNIIYIYGRLMAAECGDIDPPDPANERTPAMADVVRRCPAFIKQLATYQRIKAGEDPSKWLDENTGITQGDKNGQA